MVINPEHGHIMKNGAAGLLGAVGGVGITWMDSLEKCIQIAGGFLGCVVCIITIINGVNLWIDKRRKKK